MAIKQAKKNSQRKTQPAGGRTKPKQPPPGGNGRSWILRLYVAGKTRRCVNAFNNLKVICEDRLKGRYRIEVIDLLKDPRLARDNQILAVPTLVRKLPKPVRNIVGDLSETERVLVGLDLVDPVAVRERQS